MEGMFYRGTMQLDPRQCAERAKKVRYVLTDVDGVWTDAGVYYSQEGESLKRFNVRDGMGVERLRNAGIQTALVTREHSHFARARAKKLGIVHIFDGVMDKAGAFTQILRKIQCRPDEVAYVGDDVIDLGIMDKVKTSGLIACPGDAVEQVRRVVHYVSGVAGGQGAFRDVAEWLLSLR